MRNQHVKYLRRSEAARYVRDVLNQPCTKSLLDRLACTEEEGPEFIYLDGHWPLYTEEALRAWAETRVTTRRRKTTEAHAA